MPTRIARFILDVLSLPFLLLALLLVTLALGMREIFVGSEYRGGE